MSAAAGPGDPFARRSRVFRVTLNPRRVGSGAGDLDTRREVYVVADSFHHVLARAQAKGDRFDIEEIAVLLSEVAVLL